MHQNRFRLGLRPRPRWGSLRRSPRPPSRLGRGIPPPHTLPPSAPMAPRPSRFRRSSRRLRRLDPSASRSSRLRRSAASQRLKPTLLLPSGAATGGKWYRRERILKHEMSRISGQIKSLCVVIAILLAFTNFGHIHRFGLATPKLKPPSPR